MVTTDSSGRTARTATAPPRVTETRDDTTKESIIGTDRRAVSSQISWGAIIAGVATFLGISILLSLVTAGIGLGGAGAAAGIWSIVALALALAAAGYVAGALAIRGGLLHGFLTWATSLVIALALTVWLSASLLGAVGSALGTAATTTGQALSGSDVTEIVEDVQGNVDDGDVQDVQSQTDDALQNAQQTASDAAEDAQAAAWWGFIGLLIGAVIAAFAGMAGARSVMSRTSDAEHVRVTTTR